MSRLGGSSIRALDRSLPKIRQRFRQALALLLIAVTPSATIATAVAAVPPSLPAGAARSVRQPAAVSAASKLGTPTLSSGIRRVRALPQSGSSNGIAVSVAYADNLTPSMNFPSPWQGASNVAFYGSGTTFNAGAVRLDNTTSSAITIDSVSVDLQRPGPVFSLWTNITIPANGSAILTQTSAYNFDTSSYPIVSCGGTIPTGDTRIPLITVMQNGTPATFLDTSHVLDTGGFDLSCRGNRSLDWRPVGTTGIEAPTGSVSMSPDGSITETGNPAALSAQVVDAAGQPLANASVAFLIVSGPNAGMKSQITSNAQGTAPFSYVSLAAGTDSIQASLTNLTNTNLNATPVAANWTSQGPCPTPNAPSSGGTSLIYVGQTSVHVGDIFLAAALLTDSNGNALSGQTISFTFLASTVTAITDSTGVARTNFTATAATATTLSVNFQGSSNYAASSSTAGIVVAQESTEIQYTGPTLFSTGTAQQLTAKLTDIQHGAPLANETLTFQVGTVQASAVTNASGIAAVSINLSSGEANGPGQIQITFGGDGNYQPSLASVPAIVALQSSFVIWGGNSGGLRLGQDVNFWGSQWANQVTGGNFQANSSFKGYADNITAWQLCEVLAGSGQQTLDQNCWTAKPGNSSPPATLPQYIEVIISNAMSEQGSQIYGNIAALAVLKVDPTPAYAPDPGHPANGMIVAIMQDGANIFPAPVQLSGTQNQPSTVLPGATFSVTAQVTDAGQTAASNVVVNESFDGLQPASASQTDASLAAGGQFTAVFQEASPTYTTRQSNESSTAYEMRLAGVDGRRFTSTGTVTFTDPEGEPYLPVNFTSYSTLQLPRLDVSLKGPACVSPAATVPYVLTITNIGSAPAASASAVLTLPDGSANSVSVSNLAAGTSSVTTVNFQLAGLTADGNGETTSQYLAALALIDGTSLSASVVVNWQDAQGNSYGSVTQQTSSSTERMPIVSETPIAPATLVPGSAAVLNFTVQNSGTGNSIETDLAVTNPDKTISHAIPFSLAAGSGASASTTWSVPLLQAKQASESDAAYETRLTGLDSAALPFSVALSWKDAAGETYGPTIVTAQSTRVLPIVIPTMTALASANVGDQITYTITLQNQGQSAASGEVVSVMLPDGTRATPAVPVGGIAVGTSVQTTVSFTVPSSEGGALVTATAVVTWTDTNGNAYGSISSAAATQITNPNLPPIVSAGPNQEIELPVNSVTLQGSVASGRPGGSPTSLWTEVSGPSTATFANAAQPVTTATFPLAGSYVLRLTGTDGALSSSSSVTITVAPVNLPPTVAVGPDQTINFPTNTANLTATVTDDGFPLGSSLTSSWSQITGPGIATFANPTQANTQVTFNLPGSYILRLTASDGQYTVTGDAHVTFNGPSGGGISVNAGASQVIVTPSPATLNGSASDSNPPRGSTLTLTWTQVSGPGTTTFANPNSAVTTATFSQGGVYVLKLTATNGTYLANSDTTVYSGQVQCIINSNSTDFWTMFIGAVTGQTNSTPPRQLSLFISSATSTSGTVSVPGQGLNLPFTVTPGQITTVVLPQSVMVTTSDTVESKGIHITAQNPVAVYGLNFVSAGTDGFMALPTSTLGTSYINLGYSNSSPPVGSLDIPNALGTEFGVTATQNNTTVTIIPSAKAGTRQARQAYTVTLNQGQTYQLRNNTDLYTYSNGTGPLVDLTGSIITSNKPVAVFGGHDCAFVPNLNVYCNHLVEQLPPTNLWGQHFVTFPIARDVNGDTYRFLAQTDNTHVQVNGQEVAQINQGQFFESIIKGGAQIDADQPILVAEYANSSSFNSSNPGIDPTMILIPPFEQFGGNYTIETPTSNFTTNYVNVLAPTAAAQTGSVKLDGSSLPGSAFQPIGTSPFSGAQLTVSVGAHSLTSSLPFSIYEYGFNVLDNYGIGGGVCLAKGVTGSTLAASPKVSNAQITSQVCIQAKVADASGNPIGGIGVTFSVAGVNSTTGFVTTDATGTATFCYTSITTGSDLVTITAGSASDTASVNWISNGANQPPIVSAGPNLSISEPNNTAYLNGSVTDDGLPAGGTLTQMWSEVSGPATVNFATPTLPQTSASFPQPGMYVLQLTASDSQLTSTAGVIVNVFPPNQPPVVNAGLNKTFIWFGTQSITLNGTATDDGLPAGSTLTVNWSQVSGPTAVSFTPSSTPSTSVSFPAPGQYVLALSASDTQYTAVSYVTVNALGPVTTGYPINSTTPIVSGVPANLNADILVGGQPITPGMPINFTWFVVSVPSGGQTIFSAFTNPVTTLTVNEPGLYELTFFASDSNLGGGHGFGALYLNAAPSTPPPTVSIASPGDGSEITNLTPVVGSVSTGNWTLAYALQDDFNPMNYVTFATGSGAVTNSTLGTLDPTLLLNGTYTIRLESTGSGGQISIATTTVNVTRNMKIGVFSLSFNDLSVPLAGLPIQINRSYDSRDKGAGDFGVGWRMSVVNARLQKNHVLGLAWQEGVTFQGQFPQYCLQSSFADIVTITFPDGRVYRFQASGNPSCQPDGPITAPTMVFTQLPTSANTAGATLAPLDGGAAVVDGSIPGPVSLDGFDGNPYNPTAFILTTADGTVYSIDAQLGVTGIHDTNGNSLIIAATGITHSSGKGVLIARDLQGRVTQITDPNGSTMFYTYDSSGNLSSYTDRAGNLTAYAYDSNHDLTAITLPNGTSGLNNTYSGGRLTTTKDANNASTTFTPNFSAQTETIKDRNGNSTTYYYDNDGNVIQTTDPLGNNTSTTYDGSDNKLTDTNALGKTTKYSYDIFGNKLTETDPLNNATTYTYSPLQRVLTVTDANQNTTTNTYDNNGNLLTTVDPMQNTTTNTYYPSGLLATTRDALHNLTQFGYDASGNLTSQTDGNGTVTSYTYDGNNNRITQSVTRTLPAAQGGGTQTLLTTYTYDGNNRLIKTLYPDGAATQVVYNSLGQQATTIDALNHQTSYTYDPDGHLTKTLYPDNSTESNTYDSNGNRTIHVPRAGRNTFYFYDAMNRLTESNTSTAPSLPQAATFTGYDAAGQVISSKDANGNVTQYAYDDAGRRTTVTNALSQVTSFGYDNVGNQTSMTDALLHTTQYTYDGDNRRTQVTYPDQTFEVTAYDGLGRVTSRTDANGKATAYAYDALGRLTSVTQDPISPSNAGGLNLATTYGYDEVGNRLTQTDANQHITNYLYDQRGRRVGRTLPAGQSESYAYDANGNMSSKTDFNGRVTTYTYDSMNRVLTKTADAYFAQNHIGAAQVSYTYTASGKQATMTDASGSTSFQYDPFDRLSQKGGPEGQVNYSYDNAGNQTGVSTGNQVYAYDALNRVASVTWDLVGIQYMTASYTYDAVGNLQSVTYPNGVVQTYAYDVKNRLSSLGVKNASASLASYAYTVDNAGHRTSVAERSGRTENYGYDTIYRLTNETIASDPSGMNGAVSYSYDAVGNRLQKTSTLPGLPGATSTYNANDELAADTYDADGNTIASGTNTGTTGYVYDFENRLVHQGGISLVYDGNGNRVKKTVAGVTTQYLVADVNPTGYAQVVAEEDSFGNVQTNYIYGLELVHRYQGGLKRFYVYDGHGSVRLLTDQTGAVTDTYDYDAFGNVLHSTGTSTNNYLFAGEQYDPDLKLYYNRARYLNTSTGRFWSMDTFEGEQLVPSSLHRYLYSSADPVDRIDPSGQDDIASLSVSEGISEDLDATEAEVDFTAKKALNLKTVDIYSCSKLQAYIIPIHCWVYANQPGDLGLRYDISAVSSQRGPGLILGSVSGTLEISSTNLADVKADANLSFTKQASLSELGFVEWSAAIVSEFEFLEVFEGVSTYSANYSFNTLTNDAVNCVTFTGFAVAVAKRLAASEQ